MDGLDTKKLILRMHRGDELAAQQLWSFVASRLIAYARASLPSGMESAADDVVQGVFLKALNLRRSRLRKIQDGTAYLYKMTRNEALNHRRTETRERSRRSATDPPVEIGKDWRVEPMMEAIQDLPCDQREVLVLRYIGGLTIQQVTEVLDENRNTVASRSRLGTERLRAALSREMNNE